MRLKIKKSDEAQNGNVERGFPLLRPKSALFRYLGRTQPELMLTVLPNRAQSKTDCSDWTKYGNSSQGEKCHSRYRDRINHAQYVSGVYDTPVDLKHE